jgi:hypothetical protein
VYTPAWRPRPRLIGPVPRSRSATTSPPVPPGWFSARAAIRFAQALAIDPGAIPSRQLYRAFSYLSATRLLGGNEPAAPTGSILIEVISSPLGETNIAKLGPSGPPGGPSTV